MNIAVFGATGRTGRPLVEQALAAGHDVIAFVRDPAKLAIEDERLSLVEGDVNDSEAVERAVVNADAVVSVLGHTDSSQDDVLEVGGRNIVDAMQTHEVKRLVTLVGAGVRHENDDVGLGGKVMGVLLKTLSGDLLEDSKRHVEAFYASNLEWTVVRVPRLTEGEHTGEYRAGYLSLGMRDTISRADVADFMLRLATSEEYVREMPTVTARSTN